MNVPQVCRLLGMIALLIGAAMGASLPWSFPWFGEADAVEWRGVAGILGGMAVCGAVGAALARHGRRAAGDRLLRKEAIAVVGLSWIMATVLGAVPYWLSGTCRGMDQERDPVRMGVFDGLFESGSGFSGTGASVLSELEDPALVPRSILFWRSETHFLGGLGIMVLFVAVLGMGSAGKALMAAEMPGPAQEPTHERTQRAAWAFATIFVGLNALLTLLLLAQGVTPYHALCHAFGTIATGGFSTFNASVGHFQSASIEMTIVVFMVLGCTNFALLYLLMLGRGGKLLANSEFRVYVGILLGATAVVAGYGLAHGDFDGPAGALRYGLFQVVSITTNTGFGTDDFNRWAGFNKAVLLCLMYVGGCAGSTSCAVKVVRCVLLAKVLWLEIEQVFRPNVVRHVRLEGRPVEAPELRKEIALYFCLVAVLSAGAWLALMAIEPDSTWTAAGHSPTEKLADCASAVAATINGVGPGIGVVGAVTNYSGLQDASKFVLTCLMLLGRLEMFPLLVLFAPRFWRSQ